MDPVRKAPDSKLRQLAQRLAQLDREEREHVIAVARGGAQLPSVPWEEFWKLKGLLHLGGDAVEDSKTGPDE